MLLSNLDLLATAPGGVTRLRELILTLAVQGKLVPQDAGNEPANVLLAKIGAEKERLIAEGKIKRGKPLGGISEEERPFGLPVGWQWVRFGDASINRDGERIPVSSSERENRAKTYDYYGASGAIDKIDGFLFDKTLLLIGEDGANLINRSTPIAFLAHGKYWVNNHAHVIDTTHPELMAYLALFINAISLEPYVTGTAQPKMNQAKLNSIVIALPPLAEQSRIVTRVEELMQLCDALEAKGRLEAAQHARLVSTLLATLTDSPNPEALAENWQRVSTHFDLLLDRPEAVDALEQTLLQLAVRGLLVPQDPQDEPASALLARIRTEKDRLIAEGEIKRDKPLAAIAEEEKPFGVPVGWAWVRLGEIADNRLGKMLDKAKNTGKRYPYLRNTNVQWRHIELDDVKEISLESGELDEFRLHPGDLLICEGGYPGRCAIWNEPDREMYFQKALHRVRPRGGVAVELLAISLESDSKSGNLEQHFTGATIKHFVGQALDRYVVPLPPLPEQSRIVARVASLRRLCADLRQRLAARQATQAQLAHALIEEAA